MVDGTVIRHWVTMVAGDEAGLDGFERAIQYLAALFYADDGFLPLPRPAWLQAALDVLTGLFFRVALHTNGEKMVGMLFQICYIVGGHSETAYMWRMTGAVPYFQE